MFTPKRLISVLTLVVLSQVMLMAPAGAAPPKPAQTPYAAAISDAEHGNTGAIDRLLSGPNSAKFQAVLRTYLSDKGQLPESSAASTNASATGASTRATAVSPTIGVTPMSDTGDYNTFCTGYNGVSMGWYGQVILACHGWIDVYISGNHTQHYCPDLIPRGLTISVGCFIAVGAGVATALTIPSGGTIGWALYGTGLILATAGITVSCP